MNPELPETEPHTLGTAAATVLEPAAAPLMDAAAETPVEAPVEPAVEPAADAAAEPAPEAAAPKPPELSPAACAAALAAHFPALFGTGTPLPVKLRIQTDIQQRAPGLFSRKALSLFLHRHTTSTAYIRALLASAQRFDLDGQPAGDISEEHRAAAVTELDRRKAIVQERRAAERQQERPQQRPQQPPQQPPQQRQQQRPQQNPQQQRPQDPTLAAGTSAEDGLPSAPAGTRPPRQPNPRHERPARPSRPPRQEGSRRAQGPASDHTRRAPDGAPGPQNTVRHNAGASEPQPGQRPDHSSPADPAADAARRERSALLRTFEGSTLTKANFLVLKRMTEAELDAQLALARQERQQFPPAAQPQQPPPAARRDDRAGRR